MYRIHGKNSFYADEKEMPPETRKTRLRMWRIVVTAMFKWLADNGYTMKHPPVRSFLDRWSLYQESQQFNLNPPGRLRFFRYLQACKSYYRPHMNWRFRLVSNVNALGSLIVGYKHFYVLDQWRLTSTQFVRRIFNLPSPGRADEQAPSPKV
jgi:hypothetical protein